MTDFSSAVIAPPSDPRRGLHLDLQALVDLLEGSSPLFVWQRTMRCPCLQRNQETQNGAVDCPRCGGRTEIAFKPEVDDEPGARAEAETTGPLTALQEMFLASGAIIRGVFQSGSRDETALDRLGHWLSGRGLISTRAENLIGFRDRLTLLNAVFAYEETVLTPAAGVSWPLRFPAVRVNHVISLATDFASGDFEILDGLTTAGQVRWRPGRGTAAGARIGVHYLAHPVYVVDSWPHAVRVARDGDTIVQYPLQFAAKLEFVND